MRPVLLLSAAVMAAAGLHVISAGPDTPSVVIITLDTTRADRLSPYGFMDLQMPNLDRLADEGVVFDQAASVAPLTLPAHTSLFTGLRPPSHRVRDNADAPLDEAHVTLAEALHAGGFATAAFVGSAVLDRDRGLSPGFQVYVGPPATTLRSELPHQRRADSVVADALTWLEGAGEQPFLLWTHLYDPHEPYDPPARFRSVHSDPYIGEIAFVDAEIGRLLAGLDRIPQAKRTIVIVAGDHGEGLGEHGEATHGFSAFQTVLRVPLLIRAPGLEPRRVAQPVSLIDVYPTVMELLGMAAPTVEGRSLLAAMHGAAADNVEIYAESLYGERMGRRAVLALRAGRYKLIDGDAAALYDLERDPFETRSLHRERPELAELMRQRLEQLAGFRQESQTLAPVPRELRERLDALGYVGPATPRRGRVPGSR